MHLSDRFTSGIVPIMAVSVLAFIYRARALYGDRGVARFDTYVLDGYCNRYSLEAYGTKSRIRSGLYYFC